MESTSLLRLTIGFRLVIVILAMNLVITLAASAVQSYREYRYGIAAIEEQLADIEASFMPSIAQAVRMANEPDIRLHLAGLIRLPFIEYAELRLTGVEMPVTAGKIPAGKSLAREFPLDLSDSRPNRSPGAVRVLADLDQVQERSVGHVTEIMVGEGLASVISSLLILALVHYLVTRHLAAMASYFRDFDIRKTVAPLRLKRRKKAQEDELDEVVEAINDLRKDLLHSYSELQLAKEQLQEDITDRIEAEKALLESHSRLLTVLDSFDALVYVADLKTYEVLFLNKLGRDVFGEFHGKACWQVFRDGRQGPCASCNNSILLDSEGRPTGTHRWEHQSSRDGKWYEIRNRAIDWLDGRLVRLEIASDITDRKRSEELIKASLREKEILLREIHHRVKNNMQVISSLLSLQARKSKDREVVDSLQESRNRIRAMARIHEKLYMAKDLAHLDFNRYVEELVQSLCRAVPLGSAKIDVAIDIRDVILGLDTAMACGLIISELVSNSLKHAFPDGRDPKIRISAARCEETEPEYLLLVSDNGIGIPGHLDFRKASTLGLQLVTNLVENQLHGTIELAAQGGAAFSIRFRETKLALDQAFESTKAAI